MNSWQSLLNQPKPEATVKRLIIGDAIATNDVTVFLQTSPVLACRNEKASQNVRGSVGLAIPETQIRVVDPETMQDLPDGQKGVLLARGPGVMRGYYKDSESTQKAMSAGPGWFNTGDMGWRAPGKSLIMLRFLNGCTQAAVYFIKNSLYITIILLPWMKETKNLWMGWLFMIHLTNHILTCNAQ